MLALPLHSLLGGAQDLVLVGMRAHVGEKIALLAESLLTLELWADEWSLSRLAITSSHNSVRKFEILIAERTNLREGAGES